MNIKQKTALISTALNLLLTILKFIVFSFTGSLAILAEAWHSLTDIFTSLLVLISVTHSPKGPLPGKEREGEERATWESISLERRISFFIGLFILVAALLIVRKVQASPPPIISNPVLPGIFFLLFALGSYIVYRFETKVGREENSAGLIADGLHSKADMVGSLIAGFAMIILQLGVNVDKPAALLISVLIFSFSLETFINFFSALKGKEEWQDRATVSLAAACFEKRTWNKLFSRLEKRLNLHRLPPVALKRTKNYLRLFPVLAILVLLASSCFFVVGPTQQAIRERMGKPLNLGCPLGPGLHLKLPWLLEKVIKVDSRSVRSMNIGNVSSPRAVALLWTVQHGQEESFLSGDNNFFYPYLVLHYRIKDIFDYTYRHKKPTELLNNAATRIISNIFAGKEFFEIVTTYRKVMGEDIKRELQKEMDALRTGLEVVSINTKDIHPPVSIADSFEQVIAALQDRERMINQAIGYRNSSLPEARGVAVNSLSQAQSYVVQKTNTASGEAASFLNKYNAFRKNRDTASQKLYFQTMAETLANKQLILIDPASGVPEIWTKMGSFFPDLGE